METVQDYFGFPAAPHPYNKRTINIWYGKTGGVKEHRGGAERSDEETAQEYTESNTSEANRPNRVLMVGIEVEAENTQDIAVPFWKETQDGSLKIRGKEYTIPVEEDVAADYLSLLFSIQNKIKMSSRCSIHIHVDIRTFTLSELATLILLYIIFEKSLYNFSGKRWDSNYCVPIRTQLLGNILKYNFRHFREYFPKYGGIHLFAGDTLATIEFRQMKGTTDVDVISNWIKIVTSLVKSAKKIPLSDFLKELETMHTTSSYKNLTVDIFKECSHFIFNQPTFKEDVEEGIRLTKILVER